MIALCSRGYRAAKWRAASLSYLSFRGALFLCMALTSAAAAGISVIQRYGVPEWAQLAALGLLLLPAVVMALTTWSRIHFAPLRPSLHLFVTTRRLVEVHWTPMPEWFRRAGSWLTLRSPRAITLPRRAAAVQVERWIAHAHARGFERVRMESPLFVSRSQDGPAALRGAMGRFVASLEAMPQVVKVTISEPVPLARGQAASYRLFWPSAAHLAMCDSAGRLLGARVDIELARRPAP